MEKKLSVIDSIKCFIIGHKIAEESDCGYCWCERLGRNSNETNLPKGGIESKKKTNNTR